MKLHSGNTAILIVDMQRDFVLPGRTLCVAGAAATVPHIADIIRRGREAGAAIIHIIRLHAPDGSDAEPARRHLFDNNGAGYCVKGTAGADIVGGLEPAPSDHVVIKTRFSGFFRTTLDSLLQRLGADTLLICGTQYPNCIRATAVDAISRDYTVVVLTDCTSAQTSEIADANIADMRRMGIACVRSDEVEFQAGDINA